MKKLNLDDIRFINGISIRNVLKDLVNESNYSDEDYDFEIPKKPFQYYSKKQYDY